MSLPLPERGRVEALKRAALDILQQNRRQKDGHHYTVPSPSTYPYQWLWDSCFHAIVLAPIEPEAAKEELRSLFSRQFDNGMLPHMIYWEPSDAVKIEWGKGETSSITQPPIIAEAVWRVYEESQDRAFLEEAYPHLFHYYNYLLTERDPSDHDLAGILNPDESGEDNSPRFDAALGLAARHTLRESMEQRLKLVEELRSCDFDAPFCMKKFFWVKDVPFNAIFKKNLEVIADIARLLGYEEEAARYARHAEHTALAMRQRMLEDSVFWSTTGDGYKKIRIKTWAMFAPLYAGIPSADEARLLVDEHLLNPKEFRAEYLVPTVSMDEESFDAQGFWRGPTWMASNWFVLRGLIAYGRAEPALRILESSITLLERSGFREYFDPKTGEGLGAENFTWGALVLDMIREVEKADP